MADSEDAGFPDRLAACVALLEELAADRAPLARVDTELRRRLVEAAGRVAHPDRSALRKLAKAFRTKDREERRAHDERLLSATAIRVAQRAAVFPTPLPSSTSAPAGSHPDEPATSDRGELVEPRKCYVCKAEFKKLHAFYDQLCASCAELNWAKRHATADLGGRVALVTGSRVKIGYQAAIMLLRAGARVIVTTRFPRDAAARYARESDFDAWADRLFIYGLDLRHTPSVEAFASHVTRAFDRLDFVLNNACQTVRRPTGFYAHLLELEASPLETRPSSERRLLADYESLRIGGATPMLRAVERRHADNELEHAAGLHAPAALSQLALLDEDRNGERFFPVGMLDRDLQQIDLRERNSWRLRLHEVPAAELLEVHLVNAVAPFVLNARLKPLMQRVPSFDKHIVNVSAMEGQFYRAFKTDKHPHTNMAKAALNMMTRTSAVDYVKDGIHMNSVDTGWITDEDPARIAARKVDEHGFSPPLDVVDGAARIVDPIFSGLATGRHAWGKFFKDYAEADW